MKNHIWRPLLVAIGFVLAILSIRSFLVPPDFGIHERGYMYGWHRKGNEIEWKAVAVKYRTSSFCIKCHKKEYQEILDSPHMNIMCENCHDPAINHPEKQGSITIDRGRKLCIRCHSKLPYNSSARGIIHGIDPAKHYPEAECVLCHYPHNPHHISMKKVAKQ
jgi:predicted CXXCH cytochrome family protein